MLPFCSAGIVEFLHCHWMKTTERIIYVIDSMMDWCRGDLIATGSNDKTVKLMNFNPSTATLEGLKILYLSLTNITCSIFTFILGQLQALIHRSRERPDDARWNRSRLHICWGGSINPTLESFFLFPFERSEFKSSSDQLTLHGTLESFSGYFIRIIWS